MNVVDSSAWLEYFTDGPNAGFFAKALEDPSELLVPTVTLFEVFKVILRESDENAALQAVAVMQKGRVLDLDIGLALEAARLGLRHALPMADAMILASARAHGATLWTQDAHFKDSVGCRYFPKK